MLQPRIGDEHDARAAERTCQFAQAVEAARFEDDPPERLEIKRRQWAVRPERAGEPAAGRGG